MLNKLHRLLGVYQSRAKDNQAKAETAKDRYLQERYHRAAITWQSAADLLTLTINESVFEEARLAEGANPSLTQLFARAN